MVATDSLQLSRSYERIKLRRTVEKFADAGQATRILVCELLEHQHWAYLDHCVFVFLLAIVILLGVASGLCEGG